MPRAMEATKYWARPITHRCRKITRSWQIYLHSLSPATFSDFDSWFWTRVSLNLIAHYYLLFLQIVKALFKPKHTLFCIFWLPHQAARGSTAQPHSAGKHHQIIATYFSTAGIDAGVWKCSQKITSSLLCSSYRKGKHSTYWFVFDPFLEPWESWSFYWFCQVRE